MTQSCLTETQSPGLDETDGPICYKNISFPVKLL